MHHVLQLLIILLLLSGCQQPKTQDLSAPSSLQLVWSDEFEEAGLPNPDSWAYDVGDACNLPAGCGWGNQEKQFYTASNLKNARIENGHLVIEVHKESKGSADFTSARLKTKKKFELQYGRVEVRAKLPSGKGTWPAIWMLSSNNTYGGWPRSGEIDIMEHVGHIPDSIYGTIHTEAYNHMLGTQKGSSIHISDAETAFHKYAIDWNEQEISFSVDDQIYYSFSKHKEEASTWPFDQDFYLIINVAVGGSWGGAMGVDPTIWPQKMEIDYVRFYQ